MPCSAFWGSPHFHLTRLFQKARSSKQSNHCNSDPTFVLCPKPSSGLVDPIIHPSWPQLMNRFRTLRKWSGSPHFTQKMDPPLIDGGLIKLGQHDPSKHLPPTVTHPLSCPKLCRLRIGERKTPNEDMGRLGVFVGKEAMFTKPKQNEGRANYPRTRVCPNQGSRLFFPLNARKIG